MTLVPGLAQTETVPINGRMFITTDGGFQTTSTLATGFSAIDVAVFVDGVQLSQGGTRRVTCLNNGGLIQNICTWSISVAPALSLTSHSIEVRVADLGIGSNATVSGDSSSLLQGELTVIPLRT